MMLRSYQQELVRSVLAHLRAGRSVLAVSPTGSGKTVLAVDGLILPHVAAGGTVAFLVHLRDVVDQTEAVLRARGVPVDVVMGGRRPTGRAPVTVGTIQSVSGRDDGFAPTLVIVDEAHRTPAPWYQAVLRRCARAQVVGLTATPERSDGRALVGRSAPYDAAAWGPSVRDLIRQRHLVPSTVMSCSSADFSWLTKRRGEYDPRVYQQAARERRLVEDPVTAYQRAAKGLRTIAFAASREHGQSVAADFAAAGIAARYVDGTTPYAERNAAIEALRDGRVSVVVNVNVYVEGWNEPAVECVQVVRATASRAAWIQMVGRGKRPCDGKRACLVLDHGGNCARHGHPDDPLPWAVDGASSSSSSARRGAPPRAPAPCPSCGVMSTASLCPACGASMLVTRYAGQLAEAFAKVGG